MAKILLVSTSTAYRNRVIRLLADQDHEFVLASNFDEGLRASRLYKPALSIVDALLPEKSGFELTKEMTMDVSDTRVIITCSVDNRGVRESSIRCGARLFLLKPLDEAEFIFSVEQLLEDLKNVGNF